MSDPIQQTLSREKTSRTVFRLTAKQSFALTNYVETNYIKSSLTDVDFAKQAGEHFSLPTINARHIAACRETLEIPSNREVAREAAKHVPEAALTRLDLLDKRITSLEAQTRRLFAQASTPVKATGPTNLEILAAWENINQTHPTESHSDCLVILVRQFLPS